MFSNYFSVFEFRFYGFPADGLGPWALPMGHAHGPCRRFPMFGYFIFSWGVAGGRGHHVLYNKGRQIQTTWSEPSVNIFTSSFHMHMF